MQQDILSYEIIDTIAVISSSDDIDEAVSGQFQEMTKHLVRDGHRFLIIDLFNVRYMASSSLGLIAVVMDSLAAKNGKICLCSVHEEVKKVLELVKLDGSIEVYGSREKALSSFKGAALKPA